MMGISDDGTGAPELTLGESWIGLYEMFGLAMQAGFERMEALWLVGCMTKGVPLPDWMMEKLERNPDE